MISDMDIQSLSDREMKMIATVSKWGNSLGIRVPSDITAATGISEGDKVEITSRSDGSIIIRKKKKDVAQLKAFGALHRYANPDLIDKEKEAFSNAMVKKNVLD